MAKFTCDHCKETFEVIDNQEAEREFKELWPDLTESERSCLCEDCFKAFCTWAIQHPELMDEKQLAYSKEYVEEKANATT